ncbi:GAP family protein [Mariniluteicoccus endophyticus]
MLVGLALVDSTSVGTLVIPLWMLLGRQVSRISMIVYLAVISAFYYLLGVALLQGAGLFARMSEQVMQTQVASAVQFVLGLAMIAASYWFDPPAVRRRQERTGRQPSEPRWMTAVRSGSIGPRAAAVLALVAGGMEAASMLPYLGAVALIVGSGMSLPAQLGTLAGYVLVMVVPALVLFAVRIAVGARGDRFLGRLRDWLGRHTEGLGTTVLFVIGLLLALSGASEFF